MRAGGCRLRCRHHLPLLAAAVHPLPHAPPAPGHSCRQELHHCLAPPAVPAAPAAPAAGAALRQPCKTLSSRLPGGRARWPAGRRWLLERPPAPLPCPPLVAACLPASPPAGKGPQAVQQQLPQRRWVALPPQCPHLLPAPAALLGRLGRVLAWLAQPRHVLPQPAHHPRGGAACHGRGAAPPAGVCMAAARPQSGLSGTAGRAAPNGSPHKPGMHSSSTAC